MKENYLIFLFLAVSSSFGANLTGYFKNMNCDPGCTFEMSQNLSSETIDLFPTDCTTVCAELSIGEFSDLTETQLTSAFSNMKHLIGDLVVIGTKFKSGSFLAGLESIECGKSSVVWALNNQMIELGLTNLTSVSCASFQVFANKRLSKLGVPNLKNITQNKFMDPSDKDVLLHIDSESPDFCITIQEMENFMTAEIAYMNQIFGKFCVPAETETVCLSPNICPKVFGDVKVGPNSDLDSFNSLEIIFGSLIINGTNLTDFQFLENLKYVAQLTEDQSAIIVENNPSLHNVSFLKLKRVRSNSFYTVVFTENNRNLSRDVSGCYGLRKSLGLNTELSLTFDGDTCRAMNSTVTWLELSKALEKHSVMLGQLCQLFFFMFLYQLI